MKRAIIVCGITLTALSGAALADCSSEQAEVNRLEAGSNKLLNSGDFDSGLCQSLKFYRAKAAFLRHCAAEMGLLPLQAEQLAHKAEMDAQTVMQQTTCR